MPEKHSESECIKLDCELTRYGSQFAELLLTSLSTSTAPAAFKHAVVTPIIKKASLDPGDFKILHYRPVSNLKFVSKILEKVAFGEIGST